MVSLLGKGSSKDKSGITSFQALMTSLAARIGTGNLAGVAIAITLGGPGAIFWMWLIAFLGMATGFAESLLGQAYKVRDHEGEFRGGPAYYIKMGLNWPKVAILFSSLIFLGYGFVFSSVQANTMTDALNHNYHIAPELSGLVIVIAAGAIIFGGVKIVAKWSSVLVPVMGVSYLLIALYICAINIVEVPDLLGLIIRSAFGLEEAAAGTLGAAIINGIKRGLYSNEAGSGSVPHAAAIASPNPNHPVTQGYIQMFGVFLDTMVVCTATALIILLAQQAVGTDLTGIRLTQVAMEEHVGAIGSEFILVAVCLFSFTSIIANFVYAENNLHLFKLDTRLGKTVFTCFSLAMTYWGATSSLPKVWALADFSIGMTTLINCTVLVFLTPTIVALTKDYGQKLKEQKSMEYKLKDKSQVQGQLEKGIWD